MRWRLILAQLLILHAPDGREITVNTKQITSMFDPAKQLHEKVHCLVNLSDGKFVSVIEKCADIEKSIEMMGK